MMDLGMGLWSLGRHHVSADAGPAQPAVLIVVPTLGTRPDYLAESLISLQEQDYPHLIVCVVGPESSSARRAAAERNVLFVAQEPSGIGAAINAGWQELGAQCPVWGWLGDDDALAPGSIAVAVRALSRRGTVMAYGRCRYVDQDGVHLWTAHPGRLAAWNLPGGVDLIPQPGSLFRAQAVREVGLLDPSLRYAMDYDLFLRLRRVGRLAYVPVVLASFRWHEDSLSASQSAQSTDEAERVRKQSWRRPGLAATRDPLTRRVSKLHWHLQRRPLAIAAEGLRHMLR